MEDFVALLLVHLCMDEEAAIALFYDFLCKQLHTLSTVTEYNALIDLKLLLKHQKSIIILVQILESFISNYYFEDYLR